MTSNRSSAGGIAGGSQASAKKGKVDIDDVMMFFGRMKSGAVCSVEATRFSTGYQNKNGIEVHGDIAVEWGVFDCTYKDDPKGPALRLRGNLLRVLKRQSNGEWRFSHVMWNSQSPQ